MQCVQYGGQDCMQCVQVYSVCVMVARRYTDTLLYCAVILTSVADSLAALCWLGNIYNICDICNIALFDISNFELSYV